ncbi:MAG: hypothetical protein HY014_01795 [Acidobacteria bacterium]|nr:hypothetical protein [Acidobacteriota bacterium]MBI3486881.1 hypothetical protein [Acidobacteriota bacterium]
MTEDKKGQEALKDYADGWMQERKGTDAPGFLKLVIPIISLSGVAYLVFQMYGDVQHATRGKFVEQFNLVSKTSPVLMYVVAGLVLIYAAVVSVFAFRKPHED